ncbi:MAG: Gfo/Idh/MocA family protein [Chitinophagaceae bacterium]
MKRRTFLKSTAALSALNILPTTFSLGNRKISPVRIGIIGCGGRGSAVVSAMSQHSKISIVAMADLFDYQIQKAKPIYDSLNNTNGYPPIQKEHIYQGSTAYLKLLEDKLVDAVVISTPAYAHPDILLSAIAAGKHCYCEKPAAIDADGCHRILKASKELNGKLSTVIGFQVRHATPYVEMIKRIHAGDIGELVCAQLYYLSSMVPKVTIQTTNPDEFRIRNHFHFNELSGGILLDQGIHMLDLCNYALQSLPIHAMGSGGKKGGPNFGNTWNNYEVIYNYPNDIKVCILSTQVGNYFGDVCARFIGTNGVAEAHYNGGVFINGDNNWDSGVIRENSILTPEQIKQGATKSALHDSDFKKGTQFINSIQTGEYINHLESACESTLTAILGREAAARGEKITWEEINNSPGKINTMLNLIQFDNLQN